MMNGSSAGGSIGLLIRGSWVRVPLVQLLELNQYKKVEEQLIVEELVKK